MRRRKTTSRSGSGSAGILAATAVGWYADVRAAAAAMTATAESFTPQPAPQARYDRLYREIYQPLFPTVQPLVDRLHALTQEGA